MIHAVRVSFGRRVDPRGSTSRCPFDQRGPTRSFARETCRRRPMVRHDVSGPAVAAAGASRAQQIAAARRRKGTPASDLILVLSDFCRRPRRQLTFDGEPGHGAWPPGGPDAGNCQLRRSRSSVTRPTRGRQFRSRSMALEFGQVGAAAGQRDRQTQFFYRFCWIDYISGCNLWGLLLDSNRSTVSPSRLPPASRYRDGGFVRLIRPINLARVCALVLGAAVAMPALAQAAPAAQKTPAKTASAKKTTYSSKSSSARRARLSRARVAARAREQSRMRALQAAMTPRFKIDATGALVPDIRAAAAIILDPTPAKCSGARTPRKSDRLPASRR